MSTTTLNTHSPEAPFEELMQALDTDGYLIFPSFISARRCTAIREALAPWLQGELPGRNNFEGHKSERVYALLEKSEVFAEMAVEPLVMRFCERVLGSRFLLSACLAINVHPGETPQPLHTDDAIYPVPRPRQAYGLSTFWAIDELTESNGATEIIPGSHLWHDPPQGSPRQEGSNYPQPPKQAEPMPIVAPAGTLSIALGTLWHRGGAHRGKQSRLVITPQYCVNWARQLENMVLAVSPERAASYPQQVRELLGYNIEPPFTGYVDGMHSERVLPGWPDLP